MRLLFLTVLSLSLSGTLTGLMITVTHPITEKYLSPKWNYYIWLLVILQLMLPLHIFPALSGRLNIHFNMTAIQDHDTASDNNTGIQKHNTNIPNKDAANDSLPDTHIINHAQSASTTQNDLAIYLWFLGAMLALFVKTLNYRLFRSRINKNCARITDSRIIIIENTLCTKLHIERTPALCVSANVSGPMTIGLWNPVIIIPKGFFEQDELFDKDPHLMQLRLILHHELIHVARKDLLFKWIYQILLCIHWFNPILYWIGRQINCDCELSCDEAILSKLTEGGRQLYGNILLDIATLDIECRENALSTPLVNHNTGLKKRLDNILHYKKSTRFRLIVSACTLIIMLTVSACSTVWISSDDLSVSESRHRDSDATDHDESSPLTTVLTSLVSPEGFLDHVSSPDQSSDAWKVYDDDKLLAGDDIQDNWGAYNYAGGNNKISASGFALYGSDSFLIAYAKKEVNVKLQTSYDMAEGNFKIVYIAPDKSILPLNVSGTDTTQIITMQKGRNVLKMVGQGAKLNNLRIDYSSLKNSNFENVFYSEDEEYVFQVKDGLPAGEFIEKDKIINALYCMDGKDASEVFNTLLTAGVKFTDEELYDFFLYTDTTLSSQYLSDAIKSGNIESPGADTVSELMPYLEGDCQTELLKSLSVEEFFEVFEENIVYLNEEQISECLTDYLDRGGELTSSMYDEISPFVGIKTIKKLYTTLPELP